MLECSVSLLIPVAPMCPVVPMCEEPAPCGFAIPGPEDISFLAGLAGLPVFGEVAVFDWAKAGLAASASAATKTVSRVDIAYSP